ncbi:hypothetical protein JB92DRAFT_2968053 [Gautieria morchelliformis]|nr:hypothetical protein JB92DRAFT_2968053 [Gautieria morchelliformis]
MPARHPLRDLPLDSFLHIEHRASSKRPLSPSTALLSPSKRRILSAEGLYSPEKRGNSTPSRRLFSESVCSPSSPARKLDFAALSPRTPRKVDMKPVRDASSRPQTPVQHPGDLPSLAPSPEIASGSASSLSRTCDAPSHCSRTNDRPLPMLIPREMPTFADRRSVHWPGFDVHPDTHIAIPTSQTNPRTPDAYVIYDEDDTKENVGPCKYSRKRLALDVGKPGETARRCRTEEHAHESGDVNITSTLITPQEKGALVSQEREQGRRQNKLIMIRELDHDQEFYEEEDVEQQL